MERVWRPVVREAIEQHAVSRGLLPARKRRQIDMQKVAVIVERAVARPVLDARAPDEILGYDEYGLPR